MFSVFLGLIALSGCRVLIDTHPNDRSQERDRPRTGVEKPGPCHPSNGPPPWEPAHGYRRKCSYHYYPKSEIYYSNDADIYFWREDGEWKWGANLPDEITIRGEKVSVTLKTNKPYEKHEEVEEEYGKDERGEGPPRERGRGRGY